MSNQSLADTFATSVRKVEKVEKPGSGVVAPPHFGDVGKAANDTFSKVFPISSQSILTDYTGLSHLRCVQIRLS